MRPPFRLETGTPWRQESGDGYRVHVAPADDMRMAFAEAVARGLQDHPRWLDSRFLYDARGSEIYERITEQPEYYPTRTEDAILAENAAAIRRVVGDVTLVELGSGSSSKTRRLLDAWTAQGPARYVPIDISHTALAGAASALAASYPALTVEGIAAPYERALPLVRDLSPVLLMFLGSTIGNFPPEETDRFLGQIAASLAPGGYFLLGCDLVKDPDVLEAAYNDAAGWSAAFTRNLFRRMGQELGADIPVDAVEHVAYWNDRLERIEIHARFTRAVNVELPSFAQRFRIAPGEMVRTEISRKFRLPEVAANAARFGFELSATFTDPDQQYGLLLLRRRRSVPSFQALDFELRRLLDRVRARTHEIVAPLSERALTRQHSPLMSPLVWDLGHIAAFERLWLVESRDEGEAALPGTYDPALHPRPTRGGLALPSPQAALAELAEVRKQAHALLARDPRPGDPLSEGGYVWRMVAQHEAQHQETMLQAVQLLPDEPFAPTFADAGPPRPEQSPAGRMVLVPAGPFEMGTDDRDAAYDNERPAHRVHLADFLIDAAPVTNAAYLAFVDDGGYDRRDLWTDEGWAWRTAEQATAPLHWIRDAGGWRARVFGRLVDLDPWRPVVHVSWYEADAFARWSGKRLPTEAEWEKAASWDAARRTSRPYPWGDTPPTRDHANLGQGLLQPAPVGSYPRGRSFYGCHQMLGDVWEWTASWFAPYPGFEAFPYPEYSAPFFGEGYRVLRGGSWATLDVVARNTFRNWDLPQRRQIFAGFRCAASAGDPARRIR